MGPFIKFLFDSGIIFIWHFDKTNFYAKFVVHGCIHWGNCCDQGQGRTQTLRTVSRDIFEILKYRKLCVKSKHCTIKVFLKILGVKTFLILHSEFLRGRDFVKFQCGRSVKKFAVTSLCTNCILKSFNM